MSRIAIKAARTFNRHPARVWNRVTPQSKAGKAPPQPAVSWWLQRAPEGFTQAARAELSHRPTTQTNYRLPGQDPYWMGDR